MILTHRVIKVTEVDEEGEYTLILLKPEVSMDPTLRVLNATRGRRPVKNNSDFFRRASDAASRCRP